MVEISLLELAKSAHSNSVRGTAMPDLMNSIRTWFRITPSREFLIETYGVCHSPRFVHPHRLDELTRSFPT